MCFRIYPFLNVLNELWETFAFLSYTRLIYLFNKVMYLTCIRSELLQKHILQLPLFVITHIFFSWLLGDISFWKKGLTCTKIVLSLTVNGNYMTHWKVLWGIWGKRAVCHVHLLLFRIPDSCSEFQLLGKIRLGRPRQLEDLLQSPKSTIVNYLLSLNWYFVTWLFFLT